MTKPAILAVRLPPPWPAADAAEAIEGVRADALTPLQRSPVAECTDGADPAVPAALRPAGLTRDRFTLRTR